MEAPLQNRPFLFNRIYFVVVAVAWNYGLGVQYADEWPPSWFLWLMVPLLIPALFMGFSAMAFRFSFSAFGRKVRSPAPPEPVVESAVTGGMVGWLPASFPFLSWSVFTSSLGVHIMGVGDGYVPFHHITRFSRRFLGGCTVWHSNSEVRSPLVIPSSRIAKRIEEAIGSLSGVAA